MANYASLRNMGDPAAPDWQRSNLVPVKAANGQSWQVNKAAAQAFSGLLGDLVNEGYQPKSSGGFNYRTIRGNPNRLSQHAFGTAIDIDAANNPLGSTRTNLPANIGELAARHGLEWGGTWKNRPDPMHFEWKGQGGVPAVANTAVAANVAPGSFDAPTPNMQGVGDLVAGNNAFIPPQQDFGDLTLQALAQSQARQQQEAQAAEADQTRRAALFSGLGRSFG